jgi:hypothetical protein
MDKQVTFAKLEKLLLELKFVSQSVQGTHEVFEYSLQGTLFVQPDYKSQDCVLPIHLVSVRRILSENNLMSSIKFDTWFSSKRISV